MLMISVVQELQDLSEYSEEETAETTATVINGIVPSLHNNTPLLVAACTALSLLIVLAIIGYYYGGAKFEKGKIAVVSIITTAVFALSFPVWGIFLSWFKGIWFWFGMVIIVGIFFLANVSFFNLLFVSAKEARPTASD